MGLRGTMATCCAVFVALGMTGASFGPTLPDLAANVGSDIAALGGLISALFFGSLITQIIAGPLGDRLGQRPLLLVGMALMVAGTLSVTASRSLTLTLACAVLAGLGQGFVVLCVNLFAAELFSERSTSALNLINVFYGVGAVAGPAIASLTLRTMGTALPALWVAAALTLALLPLVFRIAAPPRPPRAATLVHPTTIFRAPVLWLFGALLFCYVGTEQGLGGWTTEYLVRTTALGAAGAALVASGFWLALTGGRVLAALLGTRVAPQTLLLGGLIGAVGSGLLLAVSTGNPTLSTVAVLLLGLCFAPVYPTMIALTAAAFPRTPGTAASIVSALGSVGAMALPWLQGVLLERVSPAASVMLIATAALAMLALHVVERLATSGRRLQGVAVER